MIARGWEHDLGGEGAEAPRKSASQATRAGLTRREFFSAVVVALRERLPPELARFRHAATMNLLKIYYANERIHYEVWTNSQTRTIEIGLHFEDGPASSAAYLAYFDSYIVELKHLLGTGIELERWTPSWGHLYDLLPLSTLDAGLVEQASARLAAMITVLQPLVVAAAVAPERILLPKTEHGPWRKWRRGRS